MKSQMFSLASVVFHKSASVYFLSCISVTYQEGLCFHKTYSYYLQNTCSLGFRLVYFTVLKRRVFSLAQNPCPHEALSTLSTFTDLSLLQIPMLFIISIFGLCGTDFMCICVIFQVDFRHPRSEDTFFIS